LSTVFRNPLPPASVGQHAIKLARSVYSGRVAEVLREAIVDGVLEAGTPLVETQLAAEPSTARSSSSAAAASCSRPGLHWPRSCRR